MKVYLIRHGATKGNIEKRYVGSTDEKLLPEAIEVLKNKKMPDVESVYSSPMKRCIETAEILYPHNEINVVNELRECDFGLFEYCNYNDLNGNRDYQRFIDTIGMCGFPQGESRDEFQNRCVRIFEKIINKENKNAAFVVHGGTIMAILDRLSYPHKDYYSWQIGNGEGFCGEITDRLYITNICKI